MRTSITATASLTVASLAGSVLTAAAGHAAARVPGDRTVTVNTVTGEHVNVRAEPSATSKVVGRRRDGQRVTIVCHKVGDEVTGTYGTSKVWDMLPGGGYVAEAYLDTGRGDPVVPECGRAVHEPRHRALAPRIHAGFTSYHW
ncbi:hypothetical protein [Sphaerisporangium corydalis]|uniref:SH3 domain-containing protein n=1 Tax=Sphaerisporangium corydalis TaxID=1441875 RepID=A0ABV9E9W2_9ACTN|nr:hypothetical protein [Sphaerisporangium corydalis]